MDKKYIFPTDFFWGVSTASHQVEGSTINQWSIWELAHASESAKKAERLWGKLPIWGDIKKQAENPSNYISGKGVEHYKRYKEDFDIAKKLNQNAFRFGIEWSRLEPEPGKWNEDEVEHYRDYIKELKRHGLEPFLNIWHWTVPVWFDELGGFTKRSNIKYFNRFVEKISQEYISEINYIITLNEPNVYTTFSYLMGEWPPNKRNIFISTLVYFNLVSAHKKAYKTLKQKHPHVQVGIANQLANIQSKRPHNFIDIAATKIMRIVWNWHFFRRIRKYQDFVGVNYYFSDYYKNIFIRDNPQFPINDMGWYMEPEGLYPLLLRTWARYKKPIFVTENGVADMHDKYRQWWLEETMIAMQRAISEGVDVAGYFHWSLLDNFEWAYGWWPKFGLVEVDRKTMERKPRSSAKWYADFIKEQSN